MAKIFIVEPIFVLLLTELNKSTDTFQLFFYEYCIFPKHVTIEIFK